MPYDNTNTFILHPVKEPRDRGPVKDGTIEISRQLIDDVAAMTGDGDNLVFEIAAWPRKGDRLGGSVQMRYRMRKEMEEQQRDGGMQAAKDAVSNWKPPGEVDADDDIPF